MAGRARRPVPRGQEKEATLPGPGEHLPPEEAADKEEEGPGRCLIKDLGFAENGRL